MTTTNDALTQAHKDVPAVPSTAPEDTQAKPPEDSTPPGPDAGNQSGDEPKGKKGERDLANVRGEFTRKLEKSNAEMRTELAEMKGLLQGLRDVPVAPAAPVQRTIQDLSAQELETLRPNAKPEQLPELDRLIQSKLVSEQIKGGIRQELGQRDFDNQRVVSNTQAYERFPDLENKTGAFYRETNKVLNEMGDSSKKNPRAVLDAANEAGIRLGLSPKAGSILMHQHDAVGGGTAPAPDGKKPMGLSKEKRDKIAKKLQNALPGGKFSQENLDNIDKNSALYDEHRDLYIKR